MSSQHAVEPQPWWQGVAWAFAILAFWLFVMTGVVWAAVS